MIPAYGRYLDGILREHQDGPDRFDGGLTHVGR
jgi:hypothetical protein